MPLSTVIPVNIDIETAVREVLSFRGAGTVYLVAGVSPESQNRLHVVSEILSRIAPQKKASRFRIIPWIAGRMPISRYPQALRQTLI